MEPNKTNIIKNYTPKVLRDQDSKGSKEQITPKEQLPIFKKPKDDMKNVTKQSFNSSPKLEKIDITSLITKFENDSGIQPFKELSTKWLELDEHVPRNMSELPNSFSLFEFLIGEGLVYKLKDWAEFEYSSLKRSASNTEGRKILTMIVAFNQRVAKFKIKLFCVNTFLHCAPQKSITITKKNETILNLLKKKSVYLHPLPENLKIKDISLFGTLKTLVREFTSIESILKDVLRCAVSLYGIVLLENRSLYSVNNSENNPVSQRVAYLLDNIAPYGARGIEPDFYYIARLLLHGPGTTSVKFNENQLKQWVSLTDEIYPLLSFLAYPLPTKPDLELYLSSASNFINIPLTAFFSGDQELSQNTFSRLINSTIHFIVITYVIVAKYCIDVSKIPKSN